SDYTVTLYATSTRGCRDSVSKPVTVYPKPKADFNAPGACLSDSASFTDQSTVKTGSITGWQWDFGDSVTSTLQNPKHKYSDTGIYIARLIIHSDKGCKDTVSKNITIHPMPQAGFRFVERCIYLGTDFLDTSSVSSGS